MELSNQLQRQQRHLHSEHTARLNDLSKRLGDIMSSIESIPSKTVGTLGEIIPAYGKEEIANRHPRLRNPPNQLYPTDLSGLEYILSDLSLMERDLSAMAKQQSLLRSLNYESRENRHEKIPKAHASTFEWIFPSRNGNTDHTTSQPSEKQLRFLRWLQSGLGIFWIFGKAGAGKSTMMKFIVNHNATVDALREWGGAKKVVLAAHYFWSAGTGMQKSLNGLLQELLYDVLQQCPDLIAEIFPDRWRKIKSPTPQNIPTSWPVDELLKGLRDLARHPAVPVKCCFFIDGLDEYDGDHYELCQLLASLSKSTNFKFCLSSRPWNVFEDAFAADTSKKMCVHELTLQDIKNYAESCLTKHSRWKDVYITNEESQQFIADIAKRAQGVFLVVKSLRDGLVNGDKIGDLQKRLEALPSDLELVFKLMLDRVEPFYHKYMAETFRFTIGVKKPLHLLTYMVREYEEEDGEYALVKDTDKQMTMSRLSSKLRNPCKRRINARCGGLPCVEMDQVEFIHRTVHDFLLTPSMQTYMKQRLNPNFKVNLSRTKALAFLIRCLLLGEITLENTNNMIDLWESLILYADVSMKEDASATVSIMDGICNIFRSCSGSGFVSIGNSIFDILSKDGHQVIDIDTITTQRSLRHNVGVPTEAHIHAQDQLYQLFLLTSGVSRFLTAKLLSYLNNLSTNGSALFTIVNIIIHRWKKQYIDVIADLLNGGFDPNEKNDIGESVWHKFLRHCVNKILFFNYDRELFVRDSGMSIFSIFLKHGAYRTRRFTVGKRNAFPFTHLALLHFVSNDIPLWSNDFLAGSHEQNRLQLEDLFYHLGEKLQEWALVLRITEMDKRDQKRADKIKLLISQGHKFGASAVSLVPGVSLYFPPILSGPLLAQIREGQKHEKRQGNSFLGLGEHQSEKSRPVKKMKLEHTSERARVGSGGKERVVIVID
jgi:hypothetical protein